MKLGFCLTTLVLYVQRIWFSINFCFQLLATCSEDFAEWRSLFGLPTLLPPALVTLHTSPPPSMGHGIVPQEFCPFCLSHSLRLTSKAASWQGSLCLPERHTFQLALLRNALDSPQGNRLSRNRLVTRNHVQLILSKTKPPRQGVLFQVRLHKILGRKVCWEATPFLGGLSRKLALS